MSVQLQNCDYREVLEGFAVRAEADRPAMICTDPAYRISAGGRTGQPRQMTGIFAAGQYSNDGAIVPVNMDWPEMARLFFATLGNGGICLAMCEQRNLPVAMPAFAAAGFKFNTLWFWDKRGHGAAGPVSKFGMKTTETAMIWRRGKYLPLQPGWTGTGQIFVSPGFCKKTDHPTEKPVRLMRQFVEAWTPPGALVLDPMMGTGSTGVACAATGRRFAGCEIDKSWFDVARARITAVRAGGGDRPPSDQADFFAAAPA